ncbi:hypothetical protein [Bacillus cereus]|uniref:Uncharacterized protein n=1 Tax=Bacillus cereus TaxID=1396 RepID=A0A2B1K342_BACCE|nr:hypothetical protein [Bacillus cereus]PFN18283.1 hypothetical protein COJ50_26070 [Bacillus cereus]
MKKIVSFALTGVISLGIGLPTEQANAATLSKGLNETNHQVTPPPDQGVDWKMVYRSEGWDGNYYVVRNSYRAYFTEGKTALKDEVILYSDSEKRNEVNRVVTRYWI